MDMCTQFGVQIGIYGVQIGIYLVHMSDIVQCVVLLLRASQTVELILNH